MIRKFWSPGKSIAVLSKNFFIEEVTKKIALFDRLVT
jgi:hypothetical protein